MTGLFSTALELLTGENGAEVESVEPPTKRARGHGKRPYAAAKSGEIAHALFLVFVRARRSRRRSPIPR